jgi:60 kDa SS-A/Ro ribonucleoprotein
MANKTLFHSVPGALIPATDAVNEELSPAYGFTPEHALAQYAITGCLNATFYASAGEQLDKLLDLAKAVDPEFAAKTAIFCRTRGYMKDTPALLCASLSVESPDLLDQIFDRVIDNAKMLRNFVQIMRSGAVGRKSLGSGPKRLVRRWLNLRSDDALFRGSVGQSPSLADIVKMVHPKPTTPQREALYGYLIGRDHDSAALPELVKEFEAFKIRQSGNAPDVPFQMLTSLKLDTDAWTEIALRAPWQTMRMNLNTFARHGVLDDQRRATRIANRLRDRKAIAKARVFPYQLMAAHLSAVDYVPGQVRDALQDALEIAIENVPRFDGKVYLFPDISGSMHSPVSGERKGGTSKVRCVDVAALIAASVLRRNRDAEVLPFESDVVKVRLDPRDTVMTNAEKLASLPGGGTNCSAPLRLLNKRNACGDLVIYVSDYESWVDGPRYSGNGGARTATMNEWAAFKRRNPTARMVCIDIQPYGSTQAKERPDILNIGGFSDQVFEVIAAYAKGELSPDHWVGCIEGVEL